MDEEIPFKSNSFGRAIFAADSQLSIALNGNFSTAPKGAAEQLFDALMAHMVPQSDMPNTIIVDTNQATRLPDNFHALMDGLKQKATALGYKVAMKEPEKTITLLEEPETVRRYRELVTGQAASRVNGAVLG